MRHGANTRPGKRKVNVKPMVNADGGVVVSDPYSEEERFLG